MPIKIKRKDFSINGRIDNLILLKIDNKKFLLEVKSTKLLPDEPKKDHIMQLQLYMYATGIWAGILLYTQKDNLQTKSFDIRCRKQTIKRILERFELLHESLTKNQMPIAESKMSKDKIWMCNYCAYEKECQDAGKV